MSTISQSILMALTVTVNKIASSNVQAVHRKQKKRSKKSTCATSTNDIGRRGLILSALVATPPLSESGAELLKKYLKKSEENKSKNDKERMDSYFKRNYKDYFEFEEGTIRAKKGELTESEKGILDWLQNNKTCRSIAETIRDAETLSYELGTLEVKWHWRKLGLNVTTQ